MTSFYYYHRLRAQGTNHEHYFLGVNNLCTSHWIILHMEKFGILSRRKDVISQITGIFGSFVYVYNICTNSLQQLYK